MNLVLVGFRGSGKTAAGREAAERLGVRFLDTDELVEQREGMKIQDIFRLKGEEYFRDVEAEVIRSLGGERGCMISVGGGAPCRDEARMILRSLGKVVWLKVSPGRAIERIKGSTRPPLTGLPLEEEVPRVLDERESRYASAADLVIETDEKNESEVADELEQIWRALQHNDLR